MIIRYLQRVLERCERLESSEKPKHLQAELQKLPRTLQEHFDQLETSGGHSHTDDQFLAELCAAMGSVRRLIDAADKAQFVIRQINWHQWATPRF